MVRIAPGVDTSLNTDTGPSNSSLQTNTAGWGVIDAVEDVQAPAAGPRREPARHGRAVGPRRLGVHHPGRVGPQSVAEVVAGLSEPIRGRGVTSGGG